MCFVSCTKHRNPAKTKPGDCSLQADRVLILGVDLKIYDHQHKYS